MKKALEIGIRTFFMLLTVSAVALLLFFPKLANTKNQPVGNKFLFLIFVFLITAALLLFLKSKAKSKTVIPGMDKIVVIASLFLFCFQVYAGYHLMFLTGWDAGVVTHISGIFAMGELEKLNSNYLSMHPNNLLLVLIQTLCLKFNRLFGIFDGPHEFMAVIVLNCAVDAFACFLVYKAASLFVSRAYALIGYLAAAALFGISPWNVICYSDPLCLAVPLLTFYLYFKEQNNPRKKTAECIGSVIVSCMGFHIKPQTFIMLIAIFIVELFLGINKKEMKKIGRLTGFVFLAIALIHGIQWGTREVFFSQGLSFDAQAKLGMPHYFMMGQNEAANGMYNVPDEEFSCSFDTIAERTAANLEVAVTRIKEMGVGGYLQHLAKKLLIAFSDGTFGWGIEERFYQTQFMDINRISGLLKSIFYGIGRRYDIYAAFAQFVWIAVLNLNLFATFFKVPEGSASTKCGTSLNKKYLALLLSVVGLILFLLIFEVQSRYLYVYAPVFCVLAAIGAAALVEKVQRSPGLKDRMKNKTKQQ